MGSALRRSGLLAAVPLLLVGCSSGRAAAVDATVARFGSAVSGGDGRAACALLAPAARAEVESSTGLPCPRGLLTEDPRAPGAVTATEVWGDSAQVRAERDTVFLARFASGWKVMAFGCVPQQGRPYDCQVQAG